MIGYFLLKLTFALRSKTQQQISTVLIFYLPDKYGAQNHFHHYRTTQKKRTLTLNLIYQLITFFSFSLSVSSSRNQGIQEDVIQSAANTVSRQPGTGGPERSYRTTQGCHLHRSQNHQRCQNLRAADVDLPVGNLLDFFFLTFRYPLYWSFGDINEPRRYGGVEIETISLMS